MRLAVVATIAVLNRFDQRNDYLHSDKAIHSAPQRIIDLEV